MAWVALVYFVFGKIALIFQLLYSIIAVIYYEDVNYIEHYGLVRKIDSNGNYESISAKHSWNAP